MHQPNERLEISFGRSQHELEQLRFSCMDHDTEKPTLRAQLDDSDQQPTYYHGLCREQEATIKDPRSKLQAAETENVPLRDESDVRSSETVSRVTPLDRHCEMDVAKTTFRKRYRAPTVESVSDEEIGLSEHIVAASEQQQDTTNHIIEVFLTFVSVTDSRMNKTQVVYARQQQLLRDVL